MELYLHKDEIDILAEKISSLKKLFNLVDKLNKQGISISINGMIRIHLEDKKMISVKKDTSEYSFPVTMDMIPKDTIENNPYDWHKNPNALVSLYLLSAPNEMRSYIIDAIYNNTDCTKSALMHTMHKKMPIMLLVTSTLKNALSLACAIQQHKGCKCGIVFRPEEDQSKDVLEGTIDAIQINEPVLVSYKGFKCIHPYIL